MTDVTANAALFLRIEVTSMGIKINGCSVSPREMDILHILWTAGEPLLASEIMESKDELKLATVHTTLTRMLKKNLITVAGFARSGNVFGRRYTHWSAARNSNHKILLVEVFISFLSPNIPFHPIFKIFPFLI